MNANEIVSQLSTSIIVELMGCDSVDGMRKCAEEKGLFPEGTSEDARDAALDDLDGLGPDRTSRAEQGHGARRSHRVIVPHPARTDSTDREGLSRSDRRTESVIA